MELEANDAQTEENEGELIDKDTKLVIERQALLNRVVSGNITDIKDRVAFILNKSIDARNSDNELAWEYWQMFEEDKLVNGMVTREAMNLLTKQTSLTRVRAKIQNGYKLFVADPVVQKYRGTLQDDHQQAEVEDRPPNLGLYQVYVDETGKTQEYLSVGSIWLLNYGISTITKAMNLRRWRDQSGYNFEFHFTEVTRNKLDAFKAFITQFISHFPDTGFKIIVVRNRGFQDKNQAITDLTYHLLDKGVDHEHESGRAPLPRMLNVSIDDEEEGSDTIKIQNLKERLRNKENLFLSEFDAVVSKDNFFIQAADMLTGAVNRKLHFPEGNNVKDELADYILDAIGFDMSSIDTENTETDRATVFNLTSRRVD